MNDDNYHQWFNHGHGERLEYRDKNGQLHRLEGPAITYIEVFKGTYAVEGSDEWWYRGEQIDCQSQKEYERILKLKAFW